MQKISEFNLKGDTASFKRAKLKRAPGTCPLSNGGTRMHVPSRTRGRPPVEVPDRTSWAEADSGASGGLGPQELRSWEDGTSPRCESHLSRVAQGCTGRNRRTMEVLLSGPDWNLTGLQKGEVRGGRGNPGGLREKLLCPSCEKRSKIQGGEARRRRGPHEWLLVWKLSEQKLKKESVMRAGLF